MTIIATYRFDDKAIFINDFRVTIRSVNASKTQADLSMKFVPIDGKIGMFLAGDVDFWKMAIEEITRQASDISIENILDPSAPFNMLLNAVTLRFGRRTGKSGAIGFIVDQVQKKNVQFNIEIVHGQGAMLEETPNYQITIMGSGKTIPNIKQELEVFFRKNLSKYNNDFYKIGYYFWIEVKKMIQQCGSLAYEKLGISPYMAKSSLVQDSFCLHGEEISGGYHSDRGSYEYNYSLLKDGNGQIIFFDHFNQEKLKVVEIMGTTPNMEEVIFDPEKVTQGVDPSQLFPGRDYIYLLHQWVIAENKTVYRSLKKIKFTKDKFLCMPLEPIIMVIDVDDEKEMQRYIDCRDQYFELDQEKSELFDSLVTAENLFNHELLALYICNYSNFVAEFKSND